MTQKQFLTDTISHFNLGNRGMNCGIGKGSYSRGCAIGRHLEMISAILLDEEGMSITWVMRNRMDLLPEWMCKMNTNFLQRVQLLHDSPIHWNKEGLSEKGQAEVNQIVRQFKLQ